RIWRAIRSRGISLENLDNAPHELGASRTPVVRFAFRSQRIAMGAISAIGGVLIAAVATAPANPDVPAVERVATLIFGWVVVALCIFMLVRSFTLGVVVRPSSVVVRNSLRSYEVPRTSQPAFEAVRQRLQPGLWVVQLTRSDGRPIRI